MGGGIFDSGSDVSKQLLDLRDTIERLNPASQGDLFAPRKLLGMIPLGPKILNYFRSYESSQTHLNAIIKSLESGQDEPPRPTSHGKSRVTATCVATYPRRREHAPGVLL